MKKTILSLLLSTGLFGLLISCFCEDVDPYFRIVEFQVDLLDENYAPITNNQTSQNSLFLDLALTTEYLAQAQANPFLHSCYATSPCPKAGQQGMKDPISDIIITSNTDFNNIPAGEPLNAIARIDGMTIQDWIADGYFQGLYYAQPHIKIHLVEKPTNNATHIFSVGITLTSAGTSTVHSDTITWN